MITKSLRMVFNKGSVPFCTMLAVLVVTATASAATVNYTYLDHIRQAVSPNNLITTTLNPDLPDPSAGPISVLDPSAGFQNALTNSVASNGWWGSSIVTFNWVGSANGVFYIDEYKAIANNTFGAAQLLARYERGFNDPVANDLFWIQTADTTLRGNNVPANEVIPYVDVYASSYANGGKLPFYFRPDETTLDNNPYVGNANIRSSSYTIGANTFNYDIAFWDQPSRPPVNSWRAELFLAYYEPATKYVQVLDGISWGFDVAAVPVPAAVWLFGSGIAGLFAFARRRRV